MKCVGFQVDHLFLFLAVSPEAVGFLSAVGLFIILLLIIFLYINKKMCFENVGGFTDLSLRYNARKNSQDKLCKYQVLWYMVVLNIHESKSDLNNVI